MGLPADNKEFIQAQILKCDFYNHIINQMMSPSSVKDQSESRFRHLLEPHLEMLENICWSLNINNPAQYIDTFNFATTEVVSEIEEPSEIGDGSSQIEDCVEDEYCDFTCESLRNEIKQRG